MRPDRHPDGPVARGASFSKAPPRCPAMQPQFSPCRRPPAETKKPPDSGGLCAPLRAGLRGSEPFAAAVAALVAVAVHVAFHPAVPPARTLTAKAPLMAGQDGETPLLALVEGLVEGIGGIGDLAHRGRGRRHAVGALAQARDRIAFLLLVL